MVSSSREMPGTPFSLTNSISSSAWGFSTLVFTGRYWRFQLFSIFWRVDSRSSPSTAFRQSSTVIIRRSVDSSVEPLIWAGFTTTVQTVALRARAFWPEVS